MLAFIACGKVVVSLGNNLPGARDMGNTAGNTRQLAAHRQHGALEVSAEMAAYAGVAKAQTEHALTATDMRAQSS